MSENAPTRLSSELDSVLNAEILTELLEQLRIPGAAIAIQSGNDSVEFAGGFGNIPEATPVTENTLFQIGSITKVFTATLLCKLHEEGIVDLNSPVIDYLPDCRIASQAPPHTLTIRTLLDYSSGIEGQYFDDFGSEPDALEKYVKACNDLRIIHRPGEMRGYNSTSYCIAGRIVEVVTGEHFDDALASRLLEPIGIHDYSFYDVENLGADTALGHHWDAEANSYAVDDILRLPRSMSPAGSSLSLTADGLLTFARMHLNDGVAVNGDRYLAEDLIREMRTPSRTVPPNNSELLIGWASLPLDGNRMTIASGATVGQNAFVYFSPEYDFAISILTNSATGGQQLFGNIGMELVEKLTGHRPVVPTATSTSDREHVQPEMDRYVGTYANPARVSAVENEGDLKLVAEFADPATGDKVTYTAAMRPIGEHTFALVLEGTEQANGTAQFLFENPDSEAASHVFTSGCVFGRL